MLEISGQTFRDVRLIGSNRTFSHVQIEGSTFAGCSLAQFDDTQLSLVVRDVEIVRCKSDRCSIHGVRFDNVRVDALSVTRMLHLYGCVFSRVTFRGKIGPIMATGPHDSLSNREEYAAGIIQAYAGVDWAIDISEAIFSDADLYYVPGQLVKRDESTQALLRREHFADIDWRSLPGNAGIWASRFESTPFDCIVAIAPKAAKDFRQCMADLEWLRARGLAE